MSTPFSRRFQQVVDQLAQGNKKTFAELTGKSVSHIYKICRGSSRPSMIWLQSLYDEFRVDLNWLLTGEQNDSGQVSGRRPDSDLVFAPVFDIQASAGTGVEVLAEDVTDYFAFQKNFLSGQLGISGDKLAFITVHGDSMVPSLNSGDQVLVDMSRSVVSHEGIYLLHTEEGLMVKRLVQKGASLKVSSDNPAYPGWEVTAGSSDQTRVIGRVVWSARMM